MDNYFTSKSLPLCVFGPGGEFRAAKLAPNSFCGKKQGLPELDGTQKTVSGKEKGSKFICEVRPRDIRTIIRICWIHICLFVAALWIELLSYRQFLLRILRYDENRQSHVMDEIRDLTKITLFDICPAAINNVGQSYVEKESGNKASVFGDTISQRILQLSKTVISDTDDVVGDRSSIIQALESYDSIACSSQTIKGDGSPGSFINKADWPIVLVGPESLAKIKECSYGRRNICTIDTETIENPNADSRLSTQTWLFPDYAGVGRRPRRNKGNRLRTRRRTRKEGSLASIQAQGTFFGAYQASSVPG